jgi:hypothetical protein
VDEYSGYFNHHYFGVFTFYLLLKIQAHSWISTLGCQGAGRIAAGGAFFSECDLF